MSRFKFFGSKKRQETNETKVFRSFMSSAFKDFLTYEAFFPNLRNVRAHPSPFKGEEDKGKDLRTTLLAFIQNPAVDINAEVEVTGVGERRTATLLEIAVAYGETEIVRKLLERGADPLAVHADDITLGMSPFAMAASFESAEMITLLAGHLDREKGGLEKALAGVGRGLWSKDNTFPPLHEAVSKGRTEVVRALLQAGADQQIRDQYGNTLLETLISAPTKGEEADTKMTQAILTIKNEFSPVRKGDLEGLSPVSAAISRGKVGVVNALLGHIDEMPGDRNQHLKHVGKAIGLAGQENLVDAEHAARCVLDVLSPERPIPDKEIQRIKQGLEEGIKTNRILGPQEKIARQADVENIVQRVLTPSVQEHQVEGAEEEKSPRDVAMGLEVQQAAQDFKRALEEREGAVEGAEQKEGPPGPSLQRSASARF